MFSAHQASFIAAFILYKGHVFLFLLYIPLPYLSHCHKSQLLWTKAKETKMGLSLPKLAPGSTPNSHLVLISLTCYFSHACNSSSWFWLWKCMDVMKATLIIIKLNNNRITYPLCRAMFLILIIILSSLYNHSYFLFWKFWGRSWQKKARRTWTNYRRNLWRESQRRQKIFRILPRSMRDSRVLGQFHLEKLS